MPSQGGSALKVIGGKDPPPPLLTHAHRTGLPQDRFLNTPATSAVPSGIKDIMARGTITTLELDSAAIVGTTGPAGTKKPRGLSLSGFSAIQKGRRIPTAPFRLPG